MKNNMPKRKLIMQSLELQLKEQSKTGKYFYNLIDDYMYLYDLKEKLQKDIKKNGLRVEVVSGNGFKSLKANESVLNLLKVTAQMLKLLTDLGLQGPTSEEPNNDDYL